MGTGFVMDSSKTSFAEVPMLLTHHVSAGDKPALKSAPARLKAASSSTVTQQRRQGPKPDSWEGGGGKKKNNKPTIHFIKCYI